jgi:hypothetical protein
MNLFFPHRRCVLCGIVALAMAFAVPARADQPGGATARPQEDFRWNLQPGQKFKVEYDQDIKQSMDAGFGEQEMPMRYTMSMSWDVKSAEGGEFRVAQTIDRIKLTASLPGLGDIEYDSSSEEEPEGFASQFAEGLKPLIGLTIDQTLNDRGVSVKCDIDEEVLQQLQNSQMGAQFANADTLKNLIAIAACSFPEKGVVKGEPWTSDQTVANAMGDITTSSTYTYEGDETVNGKSLQKIKVESKMDIKPSENATVEIELGEQSSDGVVYFDNAQGRVDHAVMNQSIKMTVLAQGQEIPVTTTGKMTFTITPADEAGAAEAPKGESGGQ